MLCLALLPLSAAGAEDRELPGPGQVARIVVHSRGETAMAFYTPRSLLEALPYLQRANVPAYMGFGKVWLWQKGVIILKDGRTMPWKAFADNLVLIDTGDGPRFYTDLEGQTTGSSGGEIVRTIYTPNGAEDVVLERK